MKTIRCSELPRLAKCLGSLGEDYVAVNVENEAATEGTAIHAQIAHWLQTGEEPDDGQPTYRTFKMFKRVLTESEYAPRFDLKDAHVEELLDKPLGLSGLRISGHPDLFGFNPGIGADIYDWKTGWNVEGDHVEQLKGYAYLILHLWGRGDSIRAIIIRRDCTAQMFEWTREELIEWAHDLGRRIETWDGRTFSVGEHCQYCPRRFACPAKQAIVKSSVEVFATPDMTFDLTDPATCIRLWRASGEVEKAVKLVRDSIKGQLAAAPDGSMSAEGERIYLSPVNKRTVDPVQSWGILEEELGQDALAGCVTIGLTALETALKAKAPRGEKEAYVGQVFGKLSTAGGLTVEAGTPKVTIKKEG